MKVKLLSSYGYKVNSSAMADSMGKILALVAYPKLGFVRIEHKNLIKQYEKYLSN